MTRPYAEVIGDPIAHSKSPLIHNFWLAKLGTDAEYRACHVRADELADYFARRREDAKWRGCNVTAPHKVTAMSEVRTRKGVRSMIGAINTIVPSSDGDLDGANTDLEGIIRPIEAVDVERGSLVVIGAGGAARAAVAASIALGFAQVLVLNRSVEKARQMLDSVRPDARVLRLTDQVPAADVLINASPLGQSGQPSPNIALELLKSTSLVFDMVYAPVETHLLKDARARGLRTIDGLQMLVGQAAAAFELFFGQPAPREHDTELRALLTA